MRPGRYLTFGCILALAMASPAAAQGSGGAGGASPPKRTVQPLPPAPIIITRPDGVVSVDPQDTDVIEDTVGRDPNPGASQAVHCPGGQTVTQAQGNVRNVICD